MIGLTDEAKQKTVRYAQKCNTTHEEEEMFFQKN